MSIRLRLAVTASVAAASTLGLVGAAGPAASAPARKAVTVRVTDTGSVVAPSTLRPGQVNLNVAKRSTDGVLVVRKKRDSIDTFVRLINDDSAAAATKRKRLFDFVVYGGAGSRNWVALTRGTYFLFDGNAPTVERSKIKVVTVKGTRSDASRPAATSIVQSSAASIPASVVLRHRYLQLVNRSTSTFLTLFVAPLSTSASRAAVDDVVSRPTFDKVDRLSRGSLRVVPAEVGPRHTVVTSASGFAKGRYLIYTGYGSRRAELRHGDLGLLTVR